MERILDPRVSSRIDRKRVNCARLKAIDSRGCVGVEGRCGRIKMADIMCLERSQCIIALVKDR